MSGRYAVQTKVRPEQSRNEIEATLQKYGADAFIYGNDSDPPRAMIAFRHSGRRYRFLLPLPTGQERELTHTREGRKRSPSDAKSALDQATRSSWRALLLLIKAKLEAVEREVTTFEEEFAAYALLPDGRTVGEVLEPQLREAYAMGRMPALLSGPVIPALPPGP